VVPTARKRARCSSEPPAKSAFPAGQVLIAMFSCVRSRAWRDSQPRFSIAILLFLAWPLIGISRDASFVPECSRPTIA
jgi:hypothetical protein